MKKFLVAILLICFLMFSGCDLSERSLDKEIETEMDIEEIKREVYEKAYKEGYNDGAGAVLNELPWYLIDLEEFEDSLYMVFEDGTYAEEIRDQILSYCETYEKEDFAIEPSTYDMDYDY